MPSYASALRVPLDLDIRQTTDLVEEIKTLRQKMDLTQEKFADRFSISLSALKNWESGRRSPDTAASLLLELILSDPDEMHRRINRVLSVHYQPYLRTGTSG